MAEPLVTRCCIAGGGPAGMMLGFLLARAGIDTIVLEKHADFFRDFRGDTIHPSTMQMMHDLGLLDEFLTRHHDEIREVRAQIGGETLTIADMRHLPTVAKFIALMPQWDFLNFLAEHAKKYPSFHLMLESDVNGLIVKNGAVRGVRATTAAGAIEIRAELTVGADGRSSTVRAAAGLTGTAMAAPMDVLWMRVSRKPGDPDQLLGIVDAGKMLVMLDRGDYWQCAYVIPKNEHAQIVAAGIEAFRAGLLALVPWLGERTSELRTFDDIKLLTVTVDRLTQWWKQGVLCIGDAAHAMSPIGGVGINLAVQDAVAAANALYPAFERGVPGTAVLRAIQRRREFPMKVIQAMQVFVQHGLIERILSSSARVRPPAVLRLLTAVPFFRRFPALLIGIGPRPEHIRTPERR